MPQEEERFLLRVESHVFDNGVQAVHRQGRIPETRRCSLAPLSESYESILPEVLCEIVTSAVHRKGARMGFLPDENSFWKSRTPESRLRVIRFACRVCSARVEGRDAK